MILSKLILNNRSGRVRSELGNLYQLHRTLMNAFPDGRDRESVRLLFRVESSRAFDTPGTIVLAQSSALPDWSLLEERRDNNYPYLSLPVQQKVFDWPESMEGCVYRFCLRANPTKRDKQTQKLFAVCDEEALYAWLERKAGQYGFAVEPGGITLRKMPKQTEYKAKGLEEMTHAVTDFSGVLQVRDDAKFKQALTVGIGRGKSFGCGLLSIVRVG